MVEDGVPGLPGELHEQPDQGLPLRDRPIRCIAGLGPVTAQGVAVLRGKNLRPLPAPGDGTRLSPALPPAT